jgi:hypothetical protein
MTGHRRADGAESEKGNVHDDVRLEDNGLQ